MASFVNSKTKFSRLVFNTASQTHVGDGLADVTALDNCTVFATETAAQNVKIPEDFELVVEIDGTGTPDTFKYSLDGGSTWYAETINCTVNTLIAYGLRVGFTETGGTTGHTVGDKWTFPIYSYKTHNPQNLVTNWCRDVETVLDVKEPVSTDMQEDTATGSLQPTDVDYSGVRTPVPIEINKTTPLDLYNFLAWMTQSNYGLTTDIDTITNTISPDYTINEANTRCIGLRSAKEVAWSRFYGMGLNSLNITFPTGEGGFCRMNTDVVGIGKYDTLPFEPVEVEGYTDDVTTSDEYGQLKR